MSIFNEMTFLLQANAILLTNKLFQAPSSQIAVTAIVCVCVCCCGSSPKIPFHLSYGGICLCTHVLELNCCAYASDGIRPNKRVTPFHLVYIYFVTVGISICYVRSTSGQK